MTASDQDERRRISDLLDLNLFVEAGAGTGKTSVLVERLFKAVKTGDTAIGEIAAITFTEDAASELIQRIRSRFEREMIEGNPSPEERDRLRDALRDIDFAAIQTIHGFARSMLSEMPLNAGLPLILDVMDDAEARLNFDGAWDSWLEVALVDQQFVSAIGRTSLLGLVGPIEKLKTAAWELNKNYDLLGQNAFAPGPEPQPIDIGDLQSMAKRWDRLLEFCDAPDDKLLVHMTANTLPLITNLVELSDSPDAVEALLAGEESVAVSTSRLGNRTNWPGDEGRYALAALREELADFHDLVERWLRETRSAVIGQLVSPVARMVREQVEVRRRTGQAGFHDLLVWARDMLRDDPEARLHFQGRYRRLFVDEFQDTDPLQVEIVQLLARRDPAGQFAPGALFVVGDPKQSIYAFRRADIQMTEQFRKFAQIDEASLTANFRSRGAILSWVNHVFGQWMGNGGAFQALYVALESGLSDSSEPDSPAEPHRVRILGGENDSNSVDEIRAEEGEAIALVAAEFGAGLHSVRDADGTNRPSSFRDLCILMPRRTALSSLERSLQDAGIPYVLQGESQLFETQEFRDMLNCLSAIDDPTDQVAVVGALRSPAFGCSDVDLWDWAASGCGFDYGDSVPETGLYVGECLADLARYHRLRNRATTPELIETFVRDRMLRELAALGEDWSQRHRRIDLISEMARSVQKSGRYSLREFVHWLRSRQSLGERMIESAPSIIGNDAVRVMTIHGAKGLEFPGVVITGLNSSPVNRRGETVFDTDPEAPVGVAIGLGSGRSRFETAGYEGIEEKKKQIGDAEAVRLMYVAATRARDHLFVSLYRKDGDSSTLAAKLAEYADSASGLQEQYAPQGGSVTPRGQAVVEPWGTRADMETWSSDISAAVAASGFPQSVSATALKSHDLPLPPQKESADDSGLEPWRKGRAATSLGSAVHAVLQELDLESGDGIVELANEQAMAHGVADHADEVASLAKAVLDSGVVMEAVRSGRYWRETPVAAGVGDGKSLEGVIDLIFESAPGELVVVDYKTDAVRGRSLPEMAEPYLPQIGAYVAAVDKTTPARVVRAVLVFARLALVGDPCEFELPDIDGAKAQALGVAREQLAVH